MTGMDLAVFLAPITDITDALVVYAPQVVAAVAVVAGGLILVRVGFRIIKSLAK